jgi:hypothetical protein
MDNQKSMDLGAVKEQIAQHTKVLDKSEAWSMLKPDCQQQFRRHHSCRR